MLIFIIIQIIHNSVFPFLHDSDVRLYQRLGNEWLSGKTLFNNLIFEYPPLSIIIFSIPSLISKILFLDPNNFEIYRIIFEFISFLCIISAAILTSKIYKSITASSESNSKKARNITFMGLVLLSSVALERFDTIVMFLTTLSLFYFTKKDGFTKHKFIAYFFLILAGLIKIYPLIFLPYYFLHDYKTKKFKSIILGFLSTILFALLHIIIFVNGAEGYTYFLKYHSERFLQIETFASSIFLFFSNLGIGDAQITYEWATFNTRGVLVDQISNLSTYFFLFLVAITFIIFAMNYFKLKKPDLQQLIIGMTISLMIFIITNKVLSTQYIVWIIPMIVISFAVLKVQMKKSASIILLISLLTIIIFPLYWNLITSKDMFLVVILLIRNIILLLLTVFLQYKLVKIISNKSYE